MKQKLIEEKAKWEAAVVELEQGKLPKELPADFPIDMALDFAKARIKVIDDQLVGL